MRIIGWIAFALVVGAQWYVPVSLVVRSESALGDGQEFHFKTQPVDPSDPFRGKYITLSFEAADIVVNDTLYHIYEQGESVYALLGTDSTGFSFVDSIYTESLPGLSLPSIKVKVAYSYIDPQGRQSVRLSFPFERFYMEESKASEAERVYWQNNRMTDSTATPTYAVVRVRDEHAVLVDVIVNDSSIVDIVRRLNADR